MKKHLIAEKDLLPIALDRLRETTGIEGEVKPVTGKNDATIILRKPGDRERVELLVEARRAVGGTPHLNNDRIREYVLVTAYVNPLEAVRLQKLGVQFMDCAGNAYINQKNLFVFVKGNKSQKRYAVKSTRLFKPSGLQIAFALLCKPDLINVTYRDLAKAAGVALGTVAWAMRDLKQQGFLLEIHGETRKLVNKTALLKQWLAGYEQQLRPKQMVNRYHAENPEWWRGADIDGGLWGGEIAAERLTGYLKPQIVTIYIAEIPDRLLLRHRLRVDPEGEIEVVAPFWNFDYPEKRDGLTPPLAVYADLMAGGDGRTKETAVMVYEKYLARYFDEN